MTKTKHDSHNALWSSSSTSRGIHVQGCATLGLHAGPVRAKSFGDAGHPHTSCKDALAHRALPSYGTELASTLQPASDVRAHGAVGRLGRWASFDLVLTASRSVDSLAGVLVLPLLRKGKRQCLSPASTRGSRSSAYVTQPLDCPLGQFPRQAGLHSIGRVVAANRVLQRDESTPALAPRPLLQWRPPLLAENWQS